jgi:hypothetical protein
VLKNSVQVIDLELLDKVGPAQGADDLRAQLESQEKFSELGEWDRKIAARALLHSTENTAHLHTVAELTTQQRFRGGVRMTRRSVQRSHCITQALRDCKSRTCADRQCSSLTRSEAAVVSDSMQITKRHRDRCIAEVGPVTRCAQKLSLSKSMRLGLRLLARAVVCHCEANKQGTALLTASSDSASCCSYR